MKLQHALSALPFLGILVGIFFANSVTLLGYALVTQLFPPLVMALAAPGRVTKWGAMAGVVAGVGVVAGMSFSGTTPGTSTTVDTFVGGLPAFIGQLNLAIVALVVNLIVMVVVSALTRGGAPARTGRFDRADAREHAIVEG